MEHLKHITLICVIFIRKHKIYYYRRQKQKKRDKSNLGRLRNKLWQKKKFVAQNKNVTIKLKFKLMALGHLKNYC